MPATVCVRAFPPSVRPSYLKHLLERCGPLLTFEFRPDELRVQFLDDSSALQAVAQLDGKTVRSGRLHVELDSHSPLCSATCRKCGSPGHL